MNLLAAYDAIVKHDQMGYNIGSLQATRVYRQLLKMHRDRQDMVKKSQPEEERPKSNGSVDIVPEKQSSTITDQQTLESEFDRIMKKQRNKDKPPKQQSSSRPLLPTLTFSKQEQ